MYIVAYLQVSILNISYFFSFFQPWKRRSIWDTHNYCNLKHTILSARAGCISTFEHILLYVWLLLSIKIWN